MKVTLRRRYQNGKRLPDMEWFNNPGIRGQLSHGAISTKTKGSVTFLSLMPLSVTNPAEKLGELYMPELASMGSRGIVFSGIESSNGAAMYQEWDIELC